MRRFILCVMLFVLTLSAYGQTPTELQNILDLVYKNDPQLASFTTRKEIATSRISMQSNLPDPKITLGLTNMPVGSFSFTQEPMSGKMIALSQGFPFPGKLSLEEKISEFDVAIVQPELKEYLLSLKKKIKQLYWKILLNKDKVKLTDELLTLVSGVEDIISTRYSLDEAKKQQLVSIQLEQSILVDQLELLNGNIRSLTDELKILAGKPGLQIDGDFPEFSPLSLNQREKIIKIIENENPVILKKRLELEKAREKQNLAEKEFYPDFNVTLQYSQRDRLAATGKELDDFLSVLVAFNIPLDYGGKRNSAIEEARLTQKLLLEQIDGVSRNVQAKAVSEIENLNTISNRIRILEEGLIPQSEVNFSSALSGVGTGVTDYLSVINALEKIVTVKFRYFDLRHAYLDGKTNLEFILGTDLNGVNNE